MFPIRTEQTSPTKHLLLYGVFAKTIGKKARKRFRLHTKLTALKFFAKHDLV